ncbi:DoxX family protein [Actinoallomurus rhizosphaericola]|uniref:DoxX family protein n=1 Tax=Actinoallomurus rhizosphaericola TaxID=2952536 RepID=UPI002090E3EA|nr:DoxX family protein [Actinoallomurus rhizosphaericola]MCO5994413.1 DoxX family protein [Actinoallomurus rhizosphaericola]
MNLNRLDGPVLSLFRIVVGLLFTLHGLASLFGVFGGNRGTGHAIAAGTWPGWYAALIQLICGALVLIGLLTRPAATLASGSMAYAYFTVHIKSGIIPLQNGGEPAAMFSWAFLLIAVLGPGTWALDSVIRHRPHRTVAARPADPRPDPATTA